MSFFDLFRWRSRKRSSSSEEDSETDDDKYPREYEEKTHAKTTIERRTATVYYEDGEEEKIEYDVRKENGDMVKVGMYDPNSDFWIKDQSKYYKRTDPKLYVKSRDPSEDQKTINFDSVKKIEVRYSYEFVVWAEVVMSVQEKKNKYGDIEGRGMLKTPEENVTWNMMEKPEYEAIHDES